MEADSVAVDVMAAGADATVARLSSHRQRTVLKMRTNRLPLIAVLCAVACPFVSFAQAPAPQVPVPAAKPEAKKPEPQARSRRARPGRGTASPAPANTGLQVVPLQAKPAGQAQDPKVDAAKALLGPDGKPLVGPDGKPLTLQLPAGAVAVPVSPTRAEPQFGGGRGRGGLVPPGGLITMEFRGTEIGNILKFFAMATNWQIVPDPGLTGPVTIISPKQLTIDQAFQVLQSTLEVRGFVGQLEKRGETTILKIVPLNVAVQTTVQLKRPPTIGPDGKPIPGQPAMTSDDYKNQVITQVIPIENVDAGALSKDLATLINKGASIVGSAGSNALIITDTAHNVQRVSDLVELLDKAAGSNETRRFPLKNADATEVTAMINNLFKQTLSRGRPSPAGQGGQPGQPQPQMGRDGQPIPQAQERAAVVAVADTRSNSIYVVASVDNMRRVEQMISELDAPNTNATETVHIKVNFGDAIEIADTINTVLSSATPGSSAGGGASFQQRVFGGGGGGGFGGGGFGGGGFGGFGGGGQQQQRQQTVQSTNPFAKVVANPRTNSLIVTATEVWMEKIEELLKELDVDVKTESTTFVVPLKNAQAQDVAYILGQAFGTGGNQNQFGGGGFGGFFGGFGGQQPRQQRQPIQRRQGAGTGGRGGGRIAPVGFTSGQDPADGIRGTMTDGGFLPDAMDGSDTSRQFFFGGGGGGQRQMQTPRFGRGQTGAFGSLLQLRNNVGVVPDPANNALIITTNPENNAAIRDIISQLDQMPRQVMIEVIIAEASLDASQKLGVQFDAKGIGKFIGSAITHGGSFGFPLGTSGSTSANIGTPINPGAQFGVQAADGKFNGLVQALANDIKVKILATPKVFTSNNQQATIDITTNVPYVTNSQNGGFTGGQSLSYDYLPIGIQLDVTPRITPDNLVTIDVLAVATELIGFDTLVSGADAQGRPQSILAPRYSERSTDTSISVKDGEVVILGGLMRDSKTLNQNKVPLLGDIPIIGGLFRSTTTNTNKTELMIFLVPHVVEGDRDSKALVDRQSAKIRRAIPELQKVHPSLVPTEDPKAPREEKSKPAPKRTDDKGQADETKPRVAPNIDPDKDKG